MKLKQRRKLIAAVMAIWLPAVPLALVLAGVRDRWSLYAALLFWGAVMFGLLKLATRQPLAS